VRNVTLKKKGKVSKDILSKSFLKNDRTFSSIINAILFQGLQVIEVEYVQSWDSEESSQSETREHDYISKECRRDIIKKVNIEGKEVIIAIEVQQEQDYTMSVRVMGYDYLEYLNQLENNQKKLLPVITIVLYFGDKKWNKVKELYGMMKEIPDVLSEYVNNYTMSVIDVKEIKIEYIKETETRKVIEAIQKLYKFRNGDSLQDLKLTKKQLMIAGELTKTKAVIEMAKEMEEEGEQDMCSAFSEYVQNKSEEAKTEGFVYGKVATIIELLTYKLGTLSNETKDMIERCNEEKLEKLMKKMFDIRSEKDIINII